MTVPDDVVPAPAKRQLAKTPVAGRVVGAVVGVLFAVVGTAFVLLPLLADGWLIRLFGGGQSCDGLPDVPPEALPPGVQVCTGSGTGGWDPLGIGSADLGPMRFMGLVGLPFALIGISVAIRAVRAATWLEGTRLVVRKGLRSRAVDLATAEVSIDLVTHRTGTDDQVVRQVPTLIARDAGATRPVQLPLLLPVAELRAVADAITAGRPDDGGAAGKVADQLRAAADNPLGHRLAAGPATD